MSKKLFVGISAGLVVPVIEALASSGASDAERITAWICGSVVACVYIACQAWEDVRLKPLQQQPVDTEAIISGVVAKLSEKK